MKLKLILPALTLAMTMPAFAEFLSPEEALSRLSEGNDHAMSRKARAVAGFSRKPVKTIKDAEGTAAAYLFRNGTEGFLILSAESEVAPVLGYSDTGDFDAENMPDAMRWWLDNYAEEISRVRKAAGTKVEGSILLPAEWKAVSPLCKTKWSQGDPYNRMTPVYNGSHCMTGCVATGMAQAMKYFNWPERGTGSITYTVTHIGSLTMNFEEAEFDWKNMSNTYGGSNTDAQKDAVALLMKACGYASRMWYNTGSSGTQSSYIADAFKNYLGYHSDTRFEERVNYSSLDWATMIYDNIVNCGPVVYSGYSNIGEGHCFICDGYDGKGFFHFNWGWGGQSDGYFLLNNLNPAEQGIGGSPGGFRCGQNAVIGMHPSNTEVKPIGAKELVQKSNLHASVNGNFFEVSTASNRNLRWVNESSETLAGSIGLRIQAYGGASEAKYIEYSDFSLEPGGALRLSALPGSKIAFDIPAQGLSDGDYQVSIVYVKNGEETHREMSTTADQYSYCQLTVNGSEYTITEVGKLTPEIEVEFSDAFYYDYKDKVKVTVHNTRPGVVTYGLAPCYLDANNNIIARGEGLMLDFEPGETISREWTYLFSFYDAPNKSRTIRYYPAIYDPTTYAVLWKAEKTVPMSAASVPDVKIGKFRVENGKKSGTTFEITDTKDVHVYTELYFNDGELPGPLHVTAWDLSTGEHKGSFLVPEYENVEVGAKGLVGNTHLDLSKVANGHNFRIYLSYYGFNQWNHLQSRSTSKELYLDLKFDPSGVDEIGGEDNALIYDKNSAVVHASLSEGIENITLFDIAGMNRLSVAGNGASSMDVELSGVASGVYIVRMVGSEGSVRTLKLMRSE